MKFRKLLCLLLVLILMAGAVPTVFAAPNADTVPYIQKLLDYYRYYQSGASEEIDSIVAVMGQEDPVQADAWGKIMDRWEYTWESMEKQMDVLPDGLPEDDSLGIVVMGYGLKSNGTMKQELIDRLTVALDSARKYPNAYVICTGGATASNSKNTEAGVMASWLRSNGISSDRIITEIKSYSTTQNAQKVYRILVNQYPQIRSLAVVTSDYHIRRSCLMLDAMAAYASSVSGTADIRVVANACCWTGKAQESLTTCAEGLAMIAGLEYASQGRPALFDGTGGESTTYAAPTQKTDSTAGKEAPKASEESTQPTASSSWGNTWVDPWDRSSYAVEDTAPYISGSEDAGSEAWS